MVRARQVRASRGKKGEGVRGEGGSGEEGRRGEEREGVGGGGEYFSMIIVSRTLYVVIIMYIYSFSRINYFVNY